MTTGTTEKTDQTMRALADWGRAPAGQPGANERPWLTSDIPPWITPPRRKAPVWATLLVAVGLVLVTWAAVVGLVVYALRAAG